MPVLILNVPILPAVDEVRTIDVIYDPCSRSMSTHQPYCRMWDLLCHEHTIRSVLIRMRLPQTMHTYVLASLHASLYSATLSVRSGHRACSHAHAAAKTEHDKMSPTSKATCKVSRGAELTTRSIIYPILAAIGTMMT